MRIPTSPDETLTYLYNPSKEDFTYNWNQVPYTMPSRNLSKFPKWLADHMAKHLAAKLAQEDDGGIHYEDKVKKYLERIYTGDLTL